MTRRPGLKGVRRRTTSPTLRVPESPRLGVPITLLTDFGNTDYFVGAVKGVILSTNPSAQIVDLTHEIPAQDIPAAAFTLLAAYKSFPKGTVHLAVVDPGVGSARRGIVVTAGEQFFLGPDNGIFSYIYEREQPFTVFELTNTKYFCHPVSPTFHGRDIFAPVAGALSQKGNPALFGKKITDPVRLEPLAPKSGKAGVTGRIRHIDRFGNCITNLTSKELTAEMIATKASLLVKGKTISSFRTFFADGPPNNGEIFCIWGSAGFLEIALANGSAAASLKVSVGDEVRLKLGS